jgi:hypothetical protein
MCRFVFFFLSVVSVFGSIGAYADSGPTYMKPRSTMSSSESPNAPMEGLELMITVYEASPNLKDLLYVTTSFKFNAEGKSKIATLAGPSGTKLGQRSGQATFLNKQKDVMVFTHEDADFEGVFTNILYFLGEGVGEMISTRDGEYLKCYARIGQCSLKPSKRKMDYTLSDYTLPELP